MIHYIFAASYSRAELLGFLGLLAALMNDVSNWLSFPVFIAWMLLCTFVAQRKEFPL